MPTHFSPLAAALALTLLVACSCGSGASHAPQPKLADDPARVRSKAKNCAELMDKARTAPVLVLIRTRRPAAGADEAAQQAARKADALACMRVRDRLPKVVLADAQDSCDGAAMISFRADEPLLRTLCADDETYTIQENRTYTLRLPPRPTEDIEAGADLVMSPEATRVRAEQCEATIKKARAEGRVRTLLQMVRPVPESADEATREAARTAATAACERVYARIPEPSRAAARNACDVALISLPADEALLTTLCADPDIYMLNEEQVLTPAGGGY